MRAPTTRFRDELAKYRQKLVIDNPGHPHQLPLALKIVDRWRKHADAEKTWETLKKHTPAEHMLTAEEFIYLVLNHGLMAGKLQQVVDELPSQERKANARAMRHRQTKNYIARGVESIYLGLTLAGRRTALSREKTAPRVKFMGELSALFEQGCGQPLYELVATLTKIVFNKKTDPEAARSAHRRSKSTG
jgi:hypothetical protein